MQFEEHNVENKPGQGGDVTGPWNRLPGSARAVVQEYSDGYKLLNLNVQKIIVMIIVQDTFVCKPGNASKLAKKFKEAMKGISETVNIMTDVSGQFNRVIVVSQYDNLTAYEKSWEKYDQHSEEMKKINELLTGYQEMYLTGSRDIFRVW